MKGRRVFKSFIALGIMLGLVHFIVAGHALAEPSDGDLRGTIRDYIQSQEQRHGAFFILDERGDQVRQLELIRVHDRVGKTGDYYYSCTDMKDVASGDELDLDFDISDTGEALEVVEIRIHKDNGVARYTYDDNDNMIPLLPPA